jgi:hypothetical protein
MGHSVVVLGTPQPEHKFRAQMNSSANTLADKGAEKSGYDK